MKSNKARILKKGIITAAVIALCGGGLYLIFNRNHAEYVEDVSPEELRQAYELLSGSLVSSDYMYTDYLMYLDADPGVGSYAAEPGGTAERYAAQDGGPEYEGRAVVLDYEESAEYKINVEKAGVYCLAVDYFSAGNSYLDYTVEVSLNGEAQYQEWKTVELSLYWQDSVEEYLKDRYGDEIAPTQNRVSAWNRTWLYNNTYSTTHPLYMTLKAGENVITLSNRSNSGLALGKLYVEAPAEETPDYAAYRASYADRQIASKEDTIVIGATDYTVKNSAEIIYKSTADPAMTPYDAEYKLLNTLSWTKPGNEIRYSFTVPRDGLYQLGFHYMNDKEEFSSYESIRIDGEVPFRELECYAFPYSDSGWANEVLSDEEGNPYYIFLTAGEHTLTLKTEMEPVISAWRYGQLIAEHVTQLTLDIKKISGQDADKYRTWKMTQYIPEIPDYLAAYKTILQHIRYELQNESEFGINGALLSYLDKAEVFIDDMAEYPDEIALYTTSLTGADNSVLVAVSKFTSSVMNVNFSLDTIYAFGEDKMPRAKAGVFAKIGSSIRTVYYSFVSEKYKTTAAAEDELNIWVSRALTHVDLLQKLADTEFTPKTGIKVKISVMPDVNKLTLACAAGETPDVALGLSSHMPFDLACRGALYDMTQYEDYWEVANRFVAGALVPYTYNEGIYAIPETLDFDAVIYRTDIFENLGLEVPDTWDELIDLLPSLQRYGMNFYHNISSGVGYKWFYQTTPLIFQNGGQLYTSDGTVTAIDQPGAVKGLKRLGELFVAYSLDTQVQEFFNSFRYSVLPIGIVDSNVYVLIKNGATELEGQWKLAPYLGTVQEDGSINRNFVANGSGGVIFADTEMPEEAWEFLKWWTDEETQVEYTYTLRSTYGDTYFWLPSNVAALEQAPIGQEDKEIILAMVQELRDVPRTPGQYLLERSISDIWNAMVFDGTSAQVAADEKVIAINREIKKKMQELGYFDEAGNRLKDYVIRDADWIQEQMDRAKEGGEQACSK
ncbi:MAG: extracellular solute-binding protein [Roseburia sp.]|nr:extracellular solute-binding protein [Roseburia sp.]MCM1099461.1 extracellular solute-binding protein [Ruminococcus flavefaciens]